MSPRERTYVVADDDTSFPLFHSMSWKKKTDESAKKRKPLVYDFLFVFCVSLYLTTYVEANAAHHQAPTGGNASTLSIPDIGFDLTADLYDILRENRKLNDVLAFINSLALIIPLVYSFYITTWVGDYSLIFRIVASQLLRSFCGWVTHLPPDASYLASNYDYPDIIHCLFKECSGEPEVMPFISFFSGHVTNLVIAGNDMWLRDIRGLSLLVHFLNVFQTVRMLATRGHYTIDIAMGWVVAVYFSNGAARLGLCYNEGMTLFDLLPKTVSQAFYTLTGISQVERDVSLNKQEVQERLRAFRNEQDDALDSVHSSFIRERSPSLSYSSSSSTS